MGLVSCIIFYVVVDGYWGRFVLGDVVRFRVLVILVFFLGDGFDRGREFLGYLRVWFWLVDGG